MFVVDGSKPFLAAMSEVGNQDVITLDFV